MGKIARFFTPHTQLLRVVVIVVAFVSLQKGGSQQAQAQTLATFDLEQLVLEPAAARMLVVGGGQTLAPGTFRLSLAGQYQKDPLVLYRGDQKVGALVGQRIGAHLLGAVALGERLELGFHLPFVASQSGDDLSAQGLASPQNAGLAAPAVSLRLSLLSERRSNPLDAAVGVAVGIPLGDKTLLARDDKVSTRVTVGIGKNLGAVELGIDASLWLRPAQSFTIGSDPAAGRQVSFAGGLATTGTVRLEMAGRAFLGLKEQGSAFELLGAVRVPAGDWLELFALAGPGFGQPAGTPAFRALAGFAIRPTKKLEPVQELPLPSDPCAAQSAPVDTCPNNDADNDGILNRVDKCPLDPEDKDGFADDDGCLDPDNDKDEVLDVNDKCPAVPGDKAFAGCPPPDADRDGVLDPDDACPNEPGPADRKGCPVKDKDGDTVMDDVDNCVDEAGPPENQGCPKQNRQLVKITKSKLMILDMVYFDTNKATIKKRSFPLLGQIAKVLREHLEVQHIRIEGHTDAQGNDERNLKLSQARAESVRAFLIKNDVDPSRLRAKGFGESVPVETNATAKGRATNRRVEFVIENSEEP